MSDGVHANHRSRVRKRYIEKGLGAFAEHEVLELLLYYCYPRRDTNEIAHKMINAFGSLASLMEADVKVIMERCGVTENIAVLVNLIPSLANLYFRSRWADRAVMDSADTAGRYAMSLFVGAVNELFYLLSLDKQMRLNHVSLVAEGSIDETAISAREIANQALQHQAAAVILTHNHPGGSIRPSRKDMESTKVIVDGMDFLKIDVVDHIIVAGEQYYSFASRGQYVKGY